MSSRTNVGLLLSFLVFMILPLTVNAEEIKFISVGEKAENVSVHKDWRIDFNMEVEEDSLNEWNIEVKEKGVGKVDGIEPYVENGSTVVVPAPEDGYRGGSTYTLFVGQTIEFKNGKDMKDRYKRVFTTEREILNPIPEPGDDVVAFGTVTSDTLNVRKDATSSSERLGAYKKGDRVEIYGYDGYWAKVDYNGQEAWLHKNYMKLRAVSGGVLQDQVIVLDPGHGAHDGGANDRQGMEKEINLDVSKRIYDKLKARGADPIMTRSTDTFLELSERVEFSEERFADLFVSIHTNAAYRSANGSETFCYQDGTSTASQSCLLAKEIQKQLVAMANMSDRGGGKHGNFHVIRETFLPAVLVELGFITNSEDYPKLMSDRYRELFAEAVTRGIEEYYKLEVN
ncbi:N-acetylmuramoyl-L-alanine amidase [Salimicrobium halophilum]|uniref:N-acetylmuramoyl-L-alanine amidase n=1 Tax=Salimicrobium halophilum TaxID=86666 RepID=A0A1G8S0H5_9BACI|nr:N-acetylmuramoyl-L-alanine amidase [Salimicrobium halophilum]SDJ22728.1 N-acetylmuramoyl-L-alanine amidase [Salimicrobium halophilum]